MKKQPHYSATLFGMLSSEERGRADRFQFAADRQRFIACRAQLRTLLAGYTADTAENISLATNAYGKLSLSGEACGTRIRFNVSHSQDLAVLAFGLDRDIGVDIEVVRSGECLDQVARTHFSADEYRFYTKTPLYRRNQVFFDCWTRKEACLKAIGLGLSFPMHQICVDLSCHRTEQQIRAGEPRSWTVEAFTPATGYQAAIVAEGSDWSPVYLSCSNLLYSDQSAAPNASSKAGIPIVGDDGKPQPPQSAIAQR